MRLLGSGAFATVHAEFSRRHGRWVAVKQQHRAPAPWFGADGGVAEECRCLAAASPHPNLPRLLGATPGDARRPATIVMDKCGDCDLYDALRVGVPPSSVTAILLGLLSAVAHLHHRRIVHRDIKPENIRVSGPGARLSCHLVDLGLARMCDHWPPLIHAQGGTPAYMAPELLSWPPSPYTDRCDCFGVGAVLCVLIAGRPTRAATGKETVRQARGSSGWAQRSPSVRDLAESLTKPKGRNRPDATSACASAARLAMGDTARQAAGLAASLRAATSAGA